MITNFFPILDLRHWWVQMITVIICPESFNPHPPAVTHMSDQQPPASLLSLKKGSKARIVGISDGAKISRLMLSHGLRVGSIINILHQRKRGVVICSGATRIALGPDMANKLQVQHIN